MTPADIIKRKRNGEELSQKEIHYFITSFMKNEVKDYQMTAFLMAIFLKDMSYEETYHLTRSYIDSGETINLDDIPGVKVDKHSTGGVGDKVSIVLAPLVASLGVPVPMISGRGLGHTGGTLDKLESIPGFRTDLSVHKFRELIKKHNFAMIGQTQEIVPADKRIYALRDVTATIENLSLITASIISKKVAEGIDALVLDIKYGNGAFMKEAHHAENLALNLIKIGKKFNKQVFASITSMDQPLGNKIGNWLEVEECLDCFKDNGPADLMEIVFELAGNMLILGQKINDKNEAREMCRKNLKSGKAFEKFLELAKAQGADIKMLENPEKYPSASEKLNFKSNKSGYLIELNAGEIGLASLELGAGRQHVEDPIDPQAGIILYKKLGDKVEKGESILEIRTNKPESIDAVKLRLEQAIIIGQNAPKIPSLIYKEIS